MRPTGFFSGCAGRAKVRRFWTIFWQRSAQSTIRSMSRRNFPSVSFWERSWEKPSTPERGLFSSWATPATISPMLESFSVCWSMMAASFCSVTSRPMSINPPFPSPRGPTVTSICRMGPSRVRSLVS